MRLDCNYAAKANSCLSFHFKAHSLTAIWNAGSLTRPILPPSKTSTSPALREMTDRLFILYRIPGKMQPSPRNFVWKMLSQKEKSRVTALRERVRYDSAVHNIISGLKADTDDDENDEEPFPPMPGSKGQISQKDAKHQPQKNDDNVFEFHERISPILMIFLLYHRKQGKCNGYCENNLIVL